MRVDSLLEVFLKGEYHVNDLVIGKEQVVLVAVGVDVWFLGELIHIRVQIKDTLIVVHLVATVVIKRINLNLVNI